MSDEYLEYIFRDGVFTRDNLERAEDYCVYPLNDRWIVASFNTRHLNNLSSEGIGYSYLPKLYGLCDLSAANSSGIEAVRNQPVLGYMGTGMYIAIIDTGINWSHRCFVNADGTSKIEVLWDQNTDIVYSNSDINSALMGKETIPKDENGHGTFMAGIAAGLEDSEREFSGVAPLAKLIIVKLKPAKKILRNLYFVPDDVPAYSETDIVRAINFVAKYSNQNKLMVSYAIGLGTSLDSHLGTSPLCEILGEEAEVSGRCISVAGGNEGNERLHYYGVANGNSPLNVELRVGEREAGVLCEIWSFAPEIYTVELISPTGQSVGRIPSKTQQSEIVSFLFDDTIVDVYYQLYEVWSGQNMVAVRFTKPSAGIWTINVYGNNLSNRTFDIWIENHNFLSGDTYFVSPSPYDTITNPGNSAKVITIGAYDHRNFSTYIGNGRGYNAYGVVKPDFVAPGVNLLGPSVNNDNGYEFRTGTSVATAFYAGVATLIQEYGLRKNVQERLRTSEIKGITIAGCMQQKGLTFPNREWGYGAVNLYNSLDATRSR